MDLSNELETLKNNINKLENFNDIKDYDNYIILRDQSIKLYENIQNLITDFINKINMLKTIIGKSEFDATQIELNSSIDRLFQIEKNLSINNHTSLEQLFLQLNEYIQLYNYVQSKITDNTISNI